MLIRFDRTAILQLYGNVHGDTLFDSMLKDSFAGNYRYVCCLCGPLTNSVYSETSIHRFRRGRDHSFC
jgi:hypothetical protein